MLLGEFLTKLPNSTNFLYNRKGYDGYMYNLET